MKTIIKQKYADQDKIKYEGYRSKFILKGMFIFVIALFVTKDGFSNPQKNVFQSQPIFGRWNSEGFDTEYPEGDRPKPSNPSNKSYKITYYYLPVESDVGTLEGYGWPENYGTSNSPTEIKFTDKTNKMVDHAFARAISCEGSGVTRDGTIVNLQTSNSNCAGLISCFYKLGPNCLKGMGAWQVPLIPYRTIASTNGNHMGEEVYIDAFRGKIMPNGMIHDGYFAIGDYCGSCSDLNHFDVFIYQANQLDFFESIVPSNNKTQGLLTGKKYSIDFAEGYCAQSGDCSTADVF